MQVEPDQPNGLRPLFEGRSYIGTDMREGPGVDRVEDLRSLSFADGEVGTALCLDTLEHCADPFAACREMHRVLRDGGLCVVTSVMFLAIHGYPDDYWRFTPEGIRALLANFDDVDVSFVGHPDAPSWVFGAATKKRALGVRLADLPSLVAAQRDYERAVGQLRVAPLRYSVRDFARLLWRELPRALRQRATARLGHARRHAESRDQDAGLDAPRRY